MKIIIGLGNPEKKYQKTRHNIGFTTLDEFQKSFAGNFNAFTLDKKLKSELSQGEINKEKIILLKTQDYYNNSGIILKNVLNYYKSNLNNVIVVHDDLDLPIGQIKIVKNAGAAGNNGVQSIIENFKTKNFIRIRIGISNKIKLKKDAADFVLNKFSSNDKKLLKESVKNAQNAIIDLIEDQLDTKKAQNLYN